MGNPDKLPPQEVLNRLAGLPGWRLEGGHLKRRYRMGDAAAARALTDRLTALTLDLKHHVTLDCQEAQVFVSLRTPDAEGLTGTDFALAQQFDPVYGELNRGWLEQLQAVAVRHLGSGPSDEPVADAAAKPRVRHGRGLWQSPRRPSHSLGRSGLSQLKGLLAELPGWRLRHGRLQAEFTFPTYRDCVEFARRAFSIAEDMDHHPDVLVQYGKVTVTLTTHSARGVTQLDFDQAKRLSKLVRR